MTSHKPLAISALPFILCLANTALCETIVLRLCLPEIADDLVDIVDIEVPPLDVGCEVIDCCKGCPGPPYALDWRITVDGDGIDGAVFQFDQLERSARSGVRVVDGHGAKVDRNQVTVGRGSVLIGGFSTDGKKKTGTAAKIAMRVDRKSVDRMLKVANERSPPDDKEGEDHSKDPVGMARILVDQLVGATIVERWVIEIEFVPCFGRGGTHEACPEPQWESVGPDHISGAMREVVVDPVNPNRLYAVSANGGVWRLDDVRAYPEEKWRPLTDDLSEATPSLNVPLSSGVNRLRFRTMAVARSAPNVVYAANSVKELLSTQPRVYSEIYRSANRGVSWTAIHTADLGVINRILVHAANPDLVFLATSTGFWKQAGTVGTWAQLRTDDCLDAELDPDDSSVIYVAVRCQGVFKSFTSGSDWSAAPILTFATTLTDNCVAPPKTFTNPTFMELALGRRNGDDTMQTTGDRTIVVRMGFQICVHNAGGEGGDSTWQCVIPCRSSQPDPAKPPVNANLATLNGGASGRSDDNPRVSGEWSNCLEVDPFDPQHIFVGGDGLLDSTDGGATWSPIGGLHEDEHCIVFDPETKELVYLANDGGLFSSINGGTTWPTMSRAHITRSPTRGLNLAKGLVTSEFRHSAVRSGRCVATIDHTGFILSDDFEGRWQFLFTSADNAQAHAHEGTSIFASPASIDQYFIINNRASNDPLTTPTNPVVNRVAQFDFTRTNGLVDPPAFQFISTDIASLPTTSGYFPDTMIYQQHVLGPVAASVSGSSRRVLIGAKATPPASGFVIRSLVLPSTGATATSAVIEATSSVPFFGIAFAPDNPDRAFAITRNGQLFERDFTTPNPMAALGTAWTFPAGNQFVSRLVACAEPTLTLYALSQHALGKFDFAAGTWSTILTWPQANETLLSFTVQPGKPTTLFLGTSQGVFIKAGSADWKALQRELPHVPVTELTFDGDLLYAATLGRGLWRCRPCP